MTRVLTVPAADATPAQFLEGFLGSYEEKRQANYRRCIAAIQRGGSLYGWPPMMVDHCKQIIAEQEALAAKVESELRFTVELQKRRAA